MTRARFVTAILFTTAACTASTGPGIGESTVVEEAAVWVSFSRVENDSRCPLRVQCVWPGDAEVVIELGPVVADAAEHRLHTNTGDSTVALGTMELALIRLDPYPEVPGGIIPEDYLVTFVVRLRPTN